MKRIVKKLEENGWTQVQDSFKALWYKRQYMIDLIGAEKTGIIRIRRKISNEEFETIGTAKIKYGNIDFSTLTHFNTGIKIDTNEIKKHYNEHL